MKLRSVSGLVAVLAGLLVAAPSLAQQEAITSTAGPGGQVLAPAPASTASYGTTDLTYVRVTGLEFFPGDGSGYNGQSLGRYPTSGVVLYAPVHLPSGSIIDYLEIVFCDSLDPQDIHLRLYDCGALGMICGLEVAEVNSFGAPGCSAISTSGFHHQVNGTGSSLMLRAVFQANSSNLQITSAIVGYRLQVSPDPVTATFLDVPAGHSQHQFVEALYAAGITVGCGSGNYCPDSAVTRGQMAVFLAKALGLHWPN